MKKEINNTDDVIDSRDIIARIEELETELGDAHEAEGNEDEFSFWLDAAANDDDHALQDAAQELITLRKVAEQGEYSPDWTYGETLVHESYFTKYIEELIDDCYEMPREFNSGNWPWRHMTIDYEAAADEAKQDYIEVDFDGETYFIHA